MNAVDARLGTRAAESGLERCNVFLDTKILKELEAIGKSLGLKTAQVIRMALAEFVKARKKGDQQ